MGVPDRPMGAGGQDAATRHRVPLPKSYQRERVSGLVARLGAVTGVSPGRGQRRHRAPPGAQGRGENSHLAVFNPLERPVYFKHMLLIFFSPRRHASVRIFISLKNIFVKKTTF